MQHDNGANRCEFPNSLPSYLPKGVTTFEPVTLVSHHSGMRIKRTNVTLKVLIAKLVYSFLRLAIDYTCKFHHFIFT